MSVGFNPKLVISGLEFCLDATNPKSYSSGNIVRDLSKNKKHCKLIGNYQTDTVDDVRCVVVKSTPQYGSGLIQENMSTIQTLSIWCKALPGQKGINPTFIDARPALVNGFIFSGNFGAGWCNTTSYYNGILVKDTRILSSTILFGVNEWKNITLVRNAPFSATGLRFFIDSNDTNSRSFAFSLIKCYSRALSEEEVVDNFLSFKGRFKL
jgi:hypothetical protein